MKNFVKKIAIFFMALSMIATCLPSISAQAATTSNRKISVTFRAGNVGTFDTSKVNLTDAAEATSQYVKISVPYSKDLTLGDVLYAGFGTSSADYIFAAITSCESGYKLLSASQCGIDTSEVIRHNAEYVMDYGVVVNPVEYTIRFVDAESYNDATGLYETEVASPIIGYGSDGETISSLTPIVDQYATNMENYSLTLAKGGENVLTIEYAYTGETYDGDVTYEDVYQYLTEDQIVTINVRNNNGGNNNGGNGNGGNAANAGGANGNADANAADGNQTDENINNNGDNTTDITDNDTPTGDGDEGDSEKEIKDDPTPKSGGFFSEMGIRILVIGAVLVVLIVGIVILITQLNKKKTKATTGAANNEHKEEK